MSEWQPIETAPKDGTWIVGLCSCSIQSYGAPKPFVFTTRWVSEFWEGWEQDGEDTKRRVMSDLSHWRGHEEPTHWMPLPEPPHNPALLAATAANAS